MKSQVAERFVRYAQIDTEADPESTSFPSSEKQKDLSRLLVAELLAMGIEDAHMDEWGYVYATIPATSNKPNVPVLCFCSHVDTAPDCSGKDVKPIVHYNWDGSDIVLPDDTSVVVSRNKHPELNDMIGLDIITASGKTLLGADDKAGVASIMQAAKEMMERKDLVHGKIRILFTPDEEVGHGVDHVDMNKLGADFGYTLDAGTRATVEEENFNADAMVVKIQGVSAHPGYAKGKMEHAIKIAADIVAALPKDKLCPEATEGREGFIHPVAIEGSLENATIRFIIRDFTLEGLKSHEELVEKTCNDVLKAYPNSQVSVKVIEQYRNMKIILDQYPQTIEYAREAIRRSGMTPKTELIRGGTDGSRLSFMGLPCPNIFTGELAIHSREEFVCVQDMEKAVETIINLAAVWEENA